MHEEGEIHKNPVEKIEQIKTERKQKVGISQEEFNLLLSQFDYTTFHGYRNKIITMLLQDTGMRIGGCLALTVDEIDFKHRVILVKKQKGEKSGMCIFHR